MKKILQISSYELSGRRFNGYDLNNSLRQGGYEPEFLAWNKESKDKYVGKLFNFPGRFLLRGGICLLERMAGIQSLLYPFSYCLFNDKHFLESEVVHYHLIHNDFFSLFNFPRLTQLRPSVWTIHDMWAATGHCLYPFECERWKTGCGECPSLRTPKRMYLDRTAYMWQVKKKIYEKLDIDIIVASQWMLNNLRESPLFSRFNIHYIPFGIDSQTFNLSDKNKNKVELGIPVDSYVISFRSTKNPFKGTSFIKEALLKMNFDKPFYLLTFEGAADLEELKGKYKIINIGWTNDPSVSAKVYSASDIFLMPSTAEAFGLMAIEAMACGCPVIAFKGTSLQDIIFSPSGGLAVERNSDALRTAIELLLNNDDYRMDIARHAVKLVEEHYTFKQYVKKHLELYEEVYSRRNDI